MTESVEERRVEVSEARGAWAAVAPDVLVEVAGSYGAVITQAELAEQVQRRTGLRTRSPWRNWLGSVLALVIAQSKNAGLPALTSLVAQRADGGEPDDATVRARLACYRRYADDVPEDVIAEAAAAARAAELAAQASPRTRRSTPRAASSRAAAPRAPRAPPREEAPPAICPTCFMQLPASGVCDTCG